MVHCMKKSWKPFKMYLGFRLIGPIFERFDTSVVLNVLILGITI